MRPQEILQRFPILCTTFPASDAVDVQLDFIDAHALQKIIRHCDDFRIRHHGRCPKVLNAKLMELTKPACLWLLISEARDIVAILARLHIRKMFAFNKSTNRRRCSFRFQRDAAVTEIFEGVHFLLDDVRGLPNSSVEQVRILKNRCTKFTKAVFVTNLKKGIFNIVPLVGILRHHVLRTLRCFNCHLYPPSNYFFVKAFHRNALYKSHCSPHSEFVLNGPTPGNISCQLHRPPGR